MPFLNMPEKIEKWGVYELTLSGPQDGNPFIEVALSAQFHHGEQTVNAQGFYDGEGSYKIRFMPGQEGMWSFTTSSDVRELNGLTGTFECTKPTGNNHGPVRVANKVHFAYEDGTPHHSFGTTCYAWTHQTESLEQQTLTTLASAPFNKMRMCVFPKHYDYNHNDPVYFPVEGSLEEGWDYTRFNPEFFRHLEKRILDLMDLGIEADLILFHPYDKWGFAKMGAEADDRYLKYIVARLSAYRNVWWSLANEYDLMDLITKSKTIEDWERFADIIVKNDPYQHLRSIHNCFGFYDHTKPWITHCSIQRQDVYKTAEFTNEWREKYQKPIVIDEVAYEGNINHGWGNIPGQELTRRFWEGTVRGGYVGHGETYMHPEDILWWSKGGVLHGTSPERIAFLRRIVEEGPVEGLSSITFGRTNWDMPCGGVPDQYYLFYFGFNQPTFRPFEMPEGIHFKVDVIDTWNMTMEALPDLYEGNFRVELPGRQYMAIRMRRVEQE